MSPIDPQDYNARVQDQQAEQNHAITPTEAVALAELEGLKKMPNILTDEEFNKLVEYLDKADFSGLPADFQGRLQFLLDASRRFTDEEYVHDLQEAELHIGLIYLMELALKLEIPELRARNDELGIKQFLGGFYIRADKVLPNLDLPDDVVAELNEGGEDVAFDLDGDGDPDIAYTPEAPFGEPTNYQEKAQEVVRGWLRSRDIAPNVYTVWFAKTLQNHKSLISTDELTGFYFEVTYDGLKNRYYLDVYLKQENIVVDAF